MRGWFLILYLVFALPATALSAPALPPRVFTVDAGKVLQAKLGANAAIIALARAEGEQALRAELHSVIDKAGTPPSGDKHDWFSQAGYWWPDPHNPGGPYIRHDGVRNPEKEQISDEAYFHHTVKAANALGLAYYLTGDERFAARAAQQLRHWFLDPATAMNPNLEYAQFVKGKNSGRSAGIVSARELPQAIDAVGYIAGAKAWTAADEAGMHRWFAACYDWLTTSDRGRDAAGRPNNHGTWYDVQVTALALYLGKTAAARDMLIGVRDRLIPAQIDAKGLQPYEMTRTKSFSYSAMNLHGLMVLATMARPLGMDLYQPAAVGGPSILTATDALAPFDRSHPWPYEQIEAGREDSLCPALYYAYGYSGKAAYLDGLKRFDCTLSAPYALVSLR